MSPRLRPAVAPVLCALALACQRPKESPDGYAARVAVERYNQRLLEAFRVQRADVLEDVAGAGEVSRVAAILSGLAAQGRHMDARQLELTPVSVSFAAREGGGRTATVRTRERWAYRHLGAGGESLKDGEALYRMTYTVVEDESRWTVERAAVDPE
ncbi:hypothetical protein [Anaeromyxobacter paludicola]|uniref:Lipoprotein n=1 Tax=Anaeromyxobacter paludicola TaxID=2918171 RepID=A0ABM7XAG9_9BACT|nr:hypothetical protein [Anaeromyxobacter paludicola]BDG08852.1 hypothetical protein AMPC_19650 [Anaeromyxobacter paludicola]